MLEYIKFLWRSPVSLTSLSKRYSEYSRIIHSQSSPTKSSVRLELFFCYIKDHMGEFLNKLPDRNSITFIQNRIGIIFVKLSLTGGVLAPFLCMYILKLCLPDQLD